MPPEIIDANWCIENIELAVEYFKEKQDEHSNLEKGLNILRSYEKELGEVYWQIRGLTKQFNRYYNEVISTKNDLESLKNEEEKGSISEELFLQRENQLRNKLTQSFQGLIESREKIRNRIPTVSWEEEINKLNVSAQKLYDDGKYNLAIEKWNLVLNIEPKNQIALEGVEKTKNKTESKGVKTKIEEPKRKEPSKRNWQIIYIIVAIIAILLIIYVFSSQFLSAMINISSPPSKSTPMGTPVSATPVSTLNASIEVLKAPPAIVAGKPFEISWRVNSPIETNINHTAIHYGPEPKFPPLNLESYRYISDILSGSVPNDFSTKITINNVEDYSAGVLYFRAHAIIEGVNYWSDEKTIMVQSTPSASITPKIDVISYPADVKGDTNFTIRWTVLGGTPGMVHHTSVFWGFQSESQNTSDYPRISTIQTGYTPAEFSVELKAPSGGTIYFRAHAIVDDTELFSPEYKITVH